ncbi:glutaredoxin-related protein 5, mitochondrial [Empidonax traillii]|uniref:glutaredoxin-related protein 5, mitochondrial n=1 Tax=Empidonax traillii TaxID=164674 RepID=UPI000FFD0F3E|nr:glutaredoxin-related protein 5, mitochondrial [Empidonax traillii]
MSAAVRVGWRLGAAAALRGRAGRPLSQAAGEGGGAQGGGGGSGSGSREAVERLVREHPVVVFMKGSPAQPLCGFSNAVVQILRLHGVEDYRAHDVLQDPDLRQGQRRDGPGSPLGAASGRAGPAALGGAGFPVGSALGRPGLL